MRMFRGAGALVVATTLAALGMSLAAEGDRQAAASRERRLPKGPGPIAISARDGIEAIVLQSDGDVYGFNMATGAIGRVLYRVPSNYQAMDAVAGVSQGRPVTCFTLNARTTERASSFILQIMPDRPEVWSWLRAAGLYVGLALDPATGTIYTSNASTNEVYAVRLGDDKARPVAISPPLHASRLGPLTIDPTANRLFVADTGAPAIYVMDLRTKAVRTLRVGLGEVRALAWAPATRRLYVADSGREAVWSIDPNAAAPAAERLFDDRRVRDPAGLALAADGSLWVADETERSLVQVSLASRTVARVVPWPVVLLKR